VDLSVVIKNLDSELMQALMTQRTKPLVSMNIAKWAMLPWRQTNQSLMTEVSNHVTRDNKPRDIESRGKEPPAILVRDIEHFPWICL
jgi:hypothetical protein